MNLTSINESLDSDIKSTQESMTKLLTLKAFLNNLPSDTVHALPDGYFFSGQLDFDGLPHTKVMEVIKLLPGRWTKEPTDNARINYSTTINGVKIRCYSGEPPPNCKIIETEETIPATPERKVVRRKLVCTDVIDTSVPA